MKRHPFLFGPLPSNICLWAALLSFAMLSTAFDRLISLAPLTGVLITEQSTLALNGSSNVNKFSCACTQKFTPIELHATMSSNRTLATFDRSVLKIATTKLDCGQKMMNRDMYETLKADHYPYILIELKKVHFPLGITLDDCAEWVELDAETVITIAGTARKVPLKVKARNLASGRFQFKSAQSVNMTDFGITPPTAMMGAVKVKDAISINFDLFVSVGQ
ncbi:MAG: hypothetical protein ACKOAY_00365 [Haliscomenobacter sp.]